MVKRWGPWALKFALSGALIWYLLRKVDLAAAWDRAQGIDPSMLALALALMLAQVAVAALRWLTVVRAIGAELSFFRLFSFFYIGAFFNIVLPGAVGGDAVRIWKSHRAGLSLGAAVNSVMLERVATVFGLVLLVAATQPFLLGRIEDQSGAWVFPALSGISLVGIAGLMMLDRLPDSFRRWKIVRGVAHFAADTRKVFLKARYAVPALVLAIIGHANLSLVVFFLALGLDIDVTVVDCLVLVPPVILIMTLPISISGWGVRETAMVAAFGFIGVPAESALVLSIIYGLVSMVMALPGGIFWLLSPDRKLGPAGLNAG